MSVDPAIAHTLDFVRRAVGSSRRRMIEIGCGGGELAAALAASGHEVVGVESDAERAAAATRRGVPVVAGSWPDQDFVARERGRCDAVLFTRSMHHMHDLGGALDAASAVLSTDGLLVVEDFAYDAVEADDVHWLLAWVNSLRAAGVLGRDSESMPWASRRGSAIDAWRADHDHGLHAWEPMHAAACRRFADVRCEVTPYLFRYLHAMLMEQRADPGTVSRVCAAALAAEGRRAHETSRPAIGRRLIARRSLAA